MVQELPDGTVTATPAAIMIGPALIAFLPEEIEYPTPTVISFSKNTEFVDAPPTAALSGNPFGFRNLVAVTIPKKFPLVAVTIPEKFPLSADTESVKVTLSGVIRSFSFESRFKTNFST